MSETTETPKDSGAEEQIRKVYARDVKTGDAVHTVFKAEKPQKQTSRGGKTFLTLHLVDRTGRLDARVFEQVEKAESAFRDGDYLLVKGRGIAFHGKPQVVIDTLERLDPTPIDPAEFAAPPEPKHEAEGHKEHREPKAPKGGSGGAKDLRARLHAVLDDPQLNKVIDVLSRHLEAYIEERIAARLGGEDHAPKARKPKVEHRPRVDEPRHEPKPSAKPPPERDPSLPKELAFKPFNLLVGEPPKP
ncbi:MAG: hypothetical protein K1X89_19160 [Myxococcaceae bacterium]|nr:hypothetical protein [Myxococcaceae bacterium]